VGATVCLVIAGASVTSTGSGLAVPDWPLSYGTLFPALEGGILFEHGHRMIAGVVLVLTTILTAWVLRRETRAWVRRLSVAALLALVLQAVLGGLTVLHRLPDPLSVSHAGLAMGFFALAVSLAVFTSPGWCDARPSSEVATSAPALALVTTCAIYLQIVLGAVVRHAGAGLAIPDFPLAFGRLVPPFDAQGVSVHFAHRMLGLAVGVCAGVTAGAARARHRGERALVVPALAVLALVLLQILLGGITVWSRKAVLPTTLHVLNGALILAASLVLALRSSRCVGADRRGVPAAGRLVHPARAGRSAAGEPPPHGVLDMLANGSTLGAGDRT
jgi:cytochrome c oxidase assembly protein subunit 15